MVHMDDTTSSPTAHEDEAPGIDAQIEELRAADPADAPSIAEDVADELQRALDQTGEAR